MMRDINSKAASDYIESKSMMKCPVNDIKLTTMLNVLISRDMENYSGWGWVDHVDWVCEIHDLDLIFLRYAVSEGCMLWTDECCSIVWLIESDKYNSHAIKLADDEDE